MTMLAGAALVAGCLAYVRTVRRRTGPGFFAPWFADLADTPRRHDPRADIELLLNHWQPDEGTALHWSLEWCARNQRTTA